MPQTVMGITESLNIAAMKGATVANVAREELAGEKFRASAQPCMMR
jgi:hypothetical protein